MGLTTGGGGDDRLQVGLAVFCVVISLMITALTPAIVPEYDADEGGALNEARQRMENFTGESMITMSPWKLTSVRTPYTANAQTNIVSEYGWVYGSIGYNYTLNGVTYLAGSVDPGTGEVTLTKTSEIIKMDPQQPSAYPLNVTDENVGYWGLALTEKWENIAQDNFWDKLLLAIDGFKTVVISTISGEDPVEAVVADAFEEGVINGNAFNFTGLMYHFDPYYRISTQGSSTTSLNSDMASLNVVWYNNPYGSGISGGLVLQSDKGNAIIANYSADEIIGSAQNGVGYATKYLLNFDGVQVYMYIQFDTQYLVGNENLWDAWNNGHWTIAFASPSADGLMDIFNSNNLSASVGSLIDTYVSIFTFDMPNCPAEWNLVLWVLCVLPLEIVMIMFLSRFGIVGTAAGILGSALAFIGGSL